MNIIHLTRHVENNHIHRGGLVDKDEVAGGIILAQPLQSLGGRDPDPRVVEDTEET